MELLGTALATLALFVSFGFTVGILFGFFGMGGSFLVTPALLVMGYPAIVAVGSGMAFVFGTAVIATVKHRDLGQVDCGLGALMIAGTTTGIEVGSRLVYRLEELGLAGLMLLGGSIAVAFQQAGDYFGIERLTTVGFALIQLSAFAVGGAVIYSTIATMRRDANAAATSAD